MKHHEVYIETTKHLHMNDLASCPTIRSQAGAAAADVVHHHIFQPLTDEIEGLHLELRRKLMTGSASPSADLAVTRTNNFGDVDNQSARKIICDSIVDSKRADGVSVPAGFY